MIEYVRSFSRLEGLQTAYQLRYTLLAQKDGWCLQVSREDALDCSTQILACCTDAAWAQRLLRYLYENAVPYDQCPEVVADILTG